MKQLTAIFFLAIFAVSYNGLWVMNYFNSLHMKAKVDRIRKAGVKEADMETFTFTNLEFATLHFEDEGEEVELDGVMYDIVTIDHLPGKKVIHCLSDAKESHYKLLAKKHRQHKNQRHKHSIPKAYVPAGRINPDLEIFTPAHPYRFSFLSESTCSISYEIIKPPPELV